MVKDMKEKVNACFNRLQTLGIAPTKGNMEILLQTLYDLQDVYQKLEELENVRDSENGTTPDPDGRDDH